MMKATALEALRRFWWVALLFALGGALIGALPAPAAAKDAEITYQATHTLLVSSDNGSIFADPIAVNQLTLYATTGEVPKRAAEALGMGSPGEATSHISSVNLDTTTGALIITATDKDPKTAEKIADTFADTLRTYMSELQEQQRTARSDALLAQEQELESKIEDLETQLDAKPDDSILQSQLDALRRKYSVVYEEQYGDTTSSQTGTLTLSSLQFAEAHAVQESTGLGAPRSRLARGSWGFVLGGLVGAGVALLMSRLDRRIRSREHAELLFGGQASVVIPDVGGAGTSLAVRPDRHDQLSESYRTLRSVLAFAQAGRVAADEHPGPARGSIILVVSPGSGDGKTSIASNLAAALVEANKRTVAVNTDFRRPSLVPRLLGRTPEPLPFLFDQLGSVPASQLLRHTETPNLVVLDLSDMEAPPGTLARATTRLLEPMAKIADAIVIDSSPLGATAEVLEFLPFADHVVVAIRLGHTLSSATQRSMQLLRSLSAGDIHLVVVGEDIERSPYYEYTTPTPKGNKARKGK